LLAVLDLTRRRKAGSDGDGRTDRRRRPPPCRITGTCRSIATVRIRPSPGGRWRRNRIGRCALRL